MNIFQNKNYRILNFLRTLLPIIAIVFVCLAPAYFAGAECPDEPCGDVKVDVKITNPLSSNISSIPAFIETLLNIVLTIGVPIIMLAIIYCGFLFVKARGNSEDLTKAKKALMYTLIGAVLVLGSWVLANAIKGTVDDIISTT